MSSRGCAYLIGIGTSAYTVKHHSVTTSIAYNQVAPCLCGVRVALLRLQLQRLGDLAKLVEILGFAGRADDDLEELPGAFELGQPAVEVRTLASNRVDADGPEHYRAVDGLLVSRAGGQDAA